MYKSFPSNEKKKVNNDESFKQNNIRKI